MKEKCGECDLTNREVKPCNQCKEFQNEIVQNNIKAGKAYERLFRERRDGFND
jgi:hypothetical protein